MIMIECSSNILEYDMVYTGLSSSMDYDTLSAGYLSA